MMETKPEVEISSRLNELFNLIQGNYQGERELEPHFPVQCIQEVVCGIEPDSPDVYACAPLLFSREKSLVDFVEKNLESARLVEDKLFQKARSNIYKLLTSWIDRFDKKGIVEHIQKVFETCFRAFQVEKGAECKKSSLLPIQSVLRIENVALNAASIQAEQNATKLFTAIDSGGKIQPSVKRDALITVGLLVKNFPQEFSERHHTYETSLGIKVRDKCFHFLRNYSDTADNTKDSVRSLVEGSFQCLSYILDVFPPPTETIRKELFGHLRKALKLFEGQTRFSIPKDAAVLLKKHVAMFTQELLENSTDIYNELFILSKSKTKILRRPAFDAAKAVLRELGKTASAFSDDPAPLIGPFMESFRDILKSATSLSNTDLLLSDIELVVSGYGYFSTPIQRACGPGRLKQLLTRLREVSDTLDRIGDQPQDSTAVLSFVSGSNIGLLDTESFDSFTNNAEEGTFFSNQQAQEERRLDAKVVTERALRHAYFLKACARIVFVLPLEFIDNRDKTAMGAEVVFLTVEYPKLHPTDRYKVGSAIRELFLALNSKGGNALDDVLKMCTRPMVLQSCEVVEQDGFFPYFHPDTGLRDGRLLFQYEGLWKALLPKRQQQNSQDISIGSVLFDNFIQVCATIIRLADLRVVFTEDAENELQHDGGLVTEGMPCNPREYTVFVNVVELLERVLPPNNPSADINALAKWGTVLAQVILERSVELPQCSGFYSLMRIVFSITDRSYHDLAVRFLDMCFIRSRTYKDEILSACLGCVLKAPVELVTERSNSFVEAIISAMRLGTTYMQLGIDTLDALESWYELNVLGTEELQRIIPHLDVFIGGSNKNKPPSESTRKQKKITKRKTKFQATVNDLEQRTIKFLGSIGGYSRFVLPSVQERLQNAFNWDITRRVALVLEIKSGKLEVYVDRILPRVVELARHSKKRKTKVAACELVHAIVLYMIGTDATNPSGSSSFVNIYKHMFSELLHLAVDSEVVARQLFHPLVGQLAAWFARNERNEHLETMTLLDAAFDGLKHKSDGALRTVSANVIGIFVKYSMKSTHNSRYDNVNIKAVLRRLYFLMRHPESSQRYGACLVFENICATIREERTYMDTHILEILKNSFVCLRLAHTDDEDLGIVETARKVVYSVCRIICGYSAELCEARVTKQEPRRGFKDLYHALRWLFEQTWRRETEMRKTAQDVFREILTAIDSSIPVWLKAYVDGKSPSVPSDGDDDFSEKQALKPSFFHQNVETIMHTSVQRNSLWMDTLSGGIDFTRWVLTSSGDIREKSRELDSLIAMINSVHGEIARDGCSHFSSISVCTLICSSSSLIQLLVGVPVGDLSQFFIVVLKLVLVPKSIKGFDGENIRIQNRLYPLIGTFLYQVVHEGLPNLKASAEEIAQSLVPSRTFGQPQIFHGPDARTLFRGLLILQRAGLNLFVSSEEFEAKKNLKGALIAIKSTEPQPLKIAALGLEFCINMGWWSCRDLICDVFSYSEFWDSLKSCILRFILDAKNWTCALEAVVENMKREKSRAMVILIDASEELLARGKLALGGMISRESFIQSVCHVVGTDLVGSLGNLERKDESFLRMLGELTGRLVSLGPGEFADGTRLAPVLDLLFASNISVRSKAEACSLLPLLLRGIACNSANFWSPINLDDVNENGLESKAMQAVNDSIVLPHFPITPLFQSLTNKQKEDFVLLVLVLFKALEETGSVFLFRVLYNHIREGVGHICASKIQSHLKSLVSKVSVPRDADLGSVAPALLLCREVFEKIWEESVNHIESPLFSLLLVPLLQRLSAGNWVEFFKMTVSFSASKKGPLLVGMVNEIFDSENLQRKSRAFDILQIFYGAVSKSRVESCFEVICHKNLNRDLCKFASKELKTIVMSRRQEPDVTFQEAGAWSDTGFLSSLDTQGKSYANSLYQFLCVAIARTQDKAYTLFNNVLFLKGVEPVWLSLVPDCVDKSTEPQFAVETSFALSKLSIDSLMANHENDGLPIKAFRVGSTFAGSSLTQFSLAPSQVVGAETKTMLIEDSTSNLGVSSVERSAKSQNPPARANYRNTPEDKMDIDKVESASSESAFNQECDADEQESMELDALNRLPCMSGTLAVLDILRKKNMMPHTTSEEAFTEAMGSKELPVWVLSIAQGLEGFDLGNSRQFLNIRLFCLKVIMNRPTLFAPFAQRLVGPCLAVLQDLEAPYKDNEAELRSRGFHYLLRDFCVLVGRWERAHRGITLPNSEQVQNLASAFVQHLMKVSPYRTKTIMTSNLQMISLLVTFWKSKIHFDKKLIIKLFTSGTNSRKNNNFKRATTERFAGLNILGILFNENVDFLKGVPSEFTGKFAQSLAKCVRWEDKQLTSVAGEVIGLVVSCLKDKATTHVLVTGFNENINIWYEDKKMPDRWLTILHAYCTGLNTSVGAIELVMDKTNMSRLFSFISSMSSSGERAKLCLQILEKCLLVESLRDNDGLIDVYFKLHPTIDRGLSFLTQQKDTLEAMMNILKVVRTEIREMSCDFLPRICELAQAGVDCDENVRLQALRFIIWMEEDYSSLVKDYADQVGLALVCGLMDPSESIRNELFEYWDAKLCDTSVYSRLLECLLKLIPCGNVNGRPVASKSSWVGLVATFMLVLVRKGPDYDNPEIKLFKKPLMDCEFHEKHVDASWKGSLASFNIVSQPLLFSQLTQQPGKPEYGGYIAATQGSGELFFPPTQQTQLGDVNFQSQLQIGSMNTRRKKRRVVKSSIPSATGSLSQSLLELDAESQKAAVGFRSDCKKQAMAPPALGSKRKRSESENETNDLFGGDLPQHLARRRFDARNFVSEGPQTAENKTTDKFRYQALRENRTKEAKIKQLRQQKERGVVMHRKYREGELPDIQITLKELIEPLLTVCIEDALVAKNMLESIADAACSRVVGNHDHDGNDMNDGAGALNEIMEALGSTLRRGVEQTQIVVCIFSLFNVVNDAVDKLPRGQSANVSNTDPTAIANSALQARCLGPGIVTLEHSISRLKQHLSQGLSSSNVLRLHWMQLLRLYDAFGEYDVLAGILDQTCPKLAVDAMELEEVHKYMEAEALYRVLINDCSPIEEVDRMERSRWWKSRINCLRSGQKWVKLRTLLRKDAHDMLCEWGDAEMEDDKSPLGMAFWHKTRYETHMLPYLQCGLRLYDEECLEVVKNATNGVRATFEVDPAEFFELAKRPDWLTRWVPLEYVVSDLQSGNSNIARSRVELLLANFTTVWSSLNDSGMASKLASLRPLMSLVDLRFFFQYREVMIASNWDGSKILGGMDKLFAKWTLSLPSRELDPPEVWDSVFFCRKSCLKSLILEMKDAHVSKTIVDQVGERFEVFSTKLANELASCALSQGDLDLAQSTLTKAESLLNLLTGKGVEMGSCTADLMETQALLHKAKAQVLSSPKSAIQELEKAQKYILKMSTSDGDIEERKRQLNSSILSELAACNPRDYEQETFQVLERYAREATQNAQAHESLADFIDKTLQEQPMTEEASPRVKQFIYELMSAMKEGSTTAVDKIPRVLSLVRRFGNSSEDVKNTFLSSSEGVPMWVFIRWVPQLLALLSHKGVGNIMEALVLKLASDYPQSLYANFNVSKICILEETLDNMDVVKVRLGKISRALDNPIFYSFVTACNGLHNPELRLKDAMKRIHFKFEQGEVEDAARMWKELVLGDVLAKEKPGVQTKIGSYNLRFANKLRRTCKLNNGVFNKETFDTFKQTLQANKLLQVPKLPPKDDLSKYSEWLSDFDAGGFHSCCLEIPGQYEDLNSVGPPRIDAHATISSFGPRVQIMQSLMLPKVIVMRGNDEKEYKYLVKGGDDLRLDNRIQQLFTVMNRMLRKDPVCAQRSLQLKTFRVIPLRTDIGLVEWIENTITFRAMFAEISRPSSSRRRGGDNLGNYQKFIQKSLGSAPGLGSHYVKLYGEKDRFKVRKAFEELQGSVSNGLIRKYLRNLAISPEGFIAIRETLARSIGVASVCGYVLGIGDRHTDNLLLSKSDGSLVLIDFGCSFGQGTTGLPIPELTPFRMTNQLQQVLEPLNSETMLFQSMVHPLRVLRKQKQALFTVMEIFLHEPLMDWASRTRKKRNDEKQKTNSFEKDHRLRVVKQKLCGIHPVEIMAQEVHSRKYDERHNCPSKNSILSILSCALDDKEHVNTEKKTFTSGKWTTLGEREQVHALMRLATNKDILALQYEGWKAWL